MLLCEMSLKNNLNNLDRHDGRRSQLNSHEIFIFLRATNRVPWVIRSYRPWNFTMISTIAHDGVLAGK